jgi:PBP1b-binding outer membrane lipoprotein LpoB
VRRSADRFVRPSSRPDTCWWCRRPWTLAASLILFVTLLFAGCTTQAPPRPHPTTPAATSAGPSDTAVSETAASLSRAETCKQFVAIVAQFTMTDEQSAVAFGDLAAKTADPDLASALTNIATEFARHDPSVPTDEVASLCD